MPLVKLAAEDDFDGWRTAARAAALIGVPPEGLHWQVGDQVADLFAGATEPPLPPAPAGAAFSVSKTFVALAETVVLHADPERFALLYAMLVRLRDQPRLIEDQTDPLRRRLEEMAKAVRRDIHKMRAFLRFREVTDADDAPRYVAWFEPEHHIVRANAGFFMRRFATMRWSILTPEIAIHWDGDTLTQGPGAARADAPEGDPIEEVWKTYYASIFNPSRLKTGAMLKEMPKKYWKNMPETALVPALIAGAQARETQMVATARTASGGDAHAALEALRAEASGCQRCPLWQPATQTVFGEGPADARLLFIGEQPGDQEDLAGRPFVGPAGQLFDRALAEAGVDRARAYVSNAVKHFKFEPRGKRRIHAKPNGGEIEACRWWIEQERAIIRPTVTVALGATAAQSLLGRAVTISRIRGQPMALADGSEGWVTVHPSFLLRLPDEDRRVEEYARFVADLRRIGERVTALADPA
ncbi:UdgX family uracil-DNA binding protein [Sphingomonas abietis]|uniref:Type-4 uracil-DNA glycosylase n=1 Tax=Sphingomonas abietis TaxID=3012344 RepID=A0ABY7NRB4_9SPHN|nr:UdgX family uracil-DNA binding protein [Sphingomonas abietis]WBO23092.1 UdgX family uracil-DNA binding protein [Sphingomonas abietis]